MTRHLPRFLFGCALAFGFGSAPALARSAGEVGPPSGVVIHLFGPGPAVTTSGDKTGAANNGGTAASGGNGGADNAASGPAPTWSDVAHEMFVTGDPAQEGQNALAKGKTGK